MGAIGRSLNPRAEDGIALVLALTVLVFFSITTVTAYTMATSTRSSATSGSSQQSAYALAEAGINSALAVLNGQLDSTGAVVTGGVSPITTTLLPSTTVQYPSLGGSDTYSGTLNTTTYVWTITSTGQVTSGSMVANKTLTRTVSVAGINSGANSGSWSRFYQDSTSSKTGDAVCGLTIDAQTFVTNVGTRGNLCLKDNGAITGSSVNVDVGGNVTIVGPDVSSGAYSPSAGTGWTSPTSVFTSNSVYATNIITHATTGANQNTTGFNFAIPANAIIHGVSVSVVRKASATSSIRDATVQLLKAGSAVGTNKADTATNWGTSNSTIGYGSTSDLWGTTWTASELNATNFGVRFAAKDIAASSSATASLDYVSVTVTYTNDANGIGTSTTSVNQLNVGGTCTYNAAASHAPCSSVDHTWATTSTTTSVANNPTLAMPAVDFNYWWANAKPGPKHFCTNPNPGITTDFFDNDGPLTGTAPNQSTTGNTTGPNKSITINGEMAPMAPTTQMPQTDYTCQVWSIPPTGGTLLGELSWRHLTHILTVSGTIFVDGNFRFDQDGEIVNYFGRATIMSSKDDEIDALVCAGGTSTTDYTTSCLANMSNWDQTQNEIVLMSQEDNEYDQGSTTCSGNTPPTCYNGHKPAGFQGILYSTADCLIHQNFQDSGPVICNTISLPNESGINPTQYTFPSIGNLTDGQKYAGAATATHFELNNGNQSG